MSLTEWNEDPSQEHPLQYRKSAFSLVIIRGSTNSTEYTYLLTVHCLNALYSIVSQKELSLQLVEKLLVFFMFLYYFCLPFSARVFLFIATNPSGLFLAQLKAFYLESIIRILNGINYI